MFRKINLDRVLAFPAFLGDGKVMFLLTHSADSHRGTENTWPFGAIAAARMLSGERHRVLEQWLLKPLDEARFQGSEEGPIFGVVVLDACETA